MANCAPYRPIVDVTELGITYRREILETLVAGWPVTVEEVVFCGLHPDWFRNATREGMVELNVATIAHPDLITAWIRGDL